MKHTQMKQSASKSFDGILTLKTSFKGCSVLKCAMKAHCRYSLNMCYLDAPESFYLNTSISAHVYPVFPLYLMTLLYVRLN